MYTPAAFAVDDAERLHLLIKENPLAVLIGARNEIPTASHVPMFLDAERNVLRCHMARANDQWQQVDGATVLAIFQGVDHYISPVWYPSMRETGKVVPTWNYVTVHVTGVARLFEDHATLLQHVTELTDANEAALNLDWRVKDAPASYIDNLLNAIVGVEIKITKMEGKWKVSQNRSTKDRQGAADGLEQVGSATSCEMARLIRKQER